MKISVIGAGSWGIALSQTISENAKVLLLARKEEARDEINNNKTFKAIYKDTKLNFKATCSYKELLDFSTNILLVVPASSVDKVCLELKKENTNPNLIISATKGFCSKTKKTPSEIIKSHFPNTKIAVLSGPSHAESLMEKAVTAVNLASNSKEAIKLSKKLIATNYFWLYESDDVKGVEFFAAAKNVYAIGAGVIDEKKILDNTKAAYVTRAMAELYRLGKAVGAKPETIFNLAGLGDLLVTAYSSNSRNYNYGKYLVTKDKKHLPTQTVEGKNTVLVLYSYMKDLNIRMPILNTIYNVVSGKITLNEGIKALTEAHHE